MRVDKELLEATPLFEKTLKITKTNIQQYTILCDLSGLEVSQSCFQNHKK